MTRADRGPVARLVPWLVRVFWAALPFTVGPPLADALDGASGAVRTLASAGLWSGWAVGMLAAAVPHPLSLTVLRVLAPALLVMPVAAAGGGHSSSLAAGWAGAVIAWVFTPALGVHCVNGPAYPNERRFPLRAPGSLMAGPLVLAWVLAIAGLSAGPLLLAARQWVAGGAAAVVGLPLAVVLLRSFHNLSRRWTVFVPAGLVLHDPLTLVDPVLFRRQVVARLGPSGPLSGRRAPAPAGSDEALDLTQGAPGLALEMTLTEAVPVTVMRPGRREGGREAPTRLRFTPTRPGAVLEEARSRRIKVG